MGTDASRVEVQEGAYPARYRKLDGVLLELFGLTTGANTWVTVTRTADLITKIECFRDPGKTDLDLEIDFTYVVGVDSVSRISTGTQIFYNFDGVEDSRITTTITRDVQDRITDVDSVFTTSESEKL